jgi:hypothetical protein
MLKLVFHVMPALRYLLLKKCEPFVEPPCTYDSRRYFQVLRNNGRSGQIARSIPPVYTALDPLWLYLNRYLYVYFLHPR